MSYGTWYSVVTDRKTFIVQPIGREYVDNTLSGNYDTFESLPDSIQSKLSVLRILEDEDEIDGIGKRLNSESYWIYI